MLPSTDEISCIGLSPACFLVAVLHSCSGGRDAVEANSVGEVCFNNSVQFRKTWKFQFMQRWISAAGSPQTPLQ